MALCPSGRVFQRRTLHLASLEILGYHRFVLLPMLPCLTFLLVLNSYRLNLPASPGLNLGSVCTFTLSFPRPPTPALTVHHITTADLKSSVHGLLTSSPPLDLLFRPFFWGSPPCSVPSPFRAFDAPVCSVVGCQGTQ